MHESRNATDESLIRFYFRAFAANLAERSSYHSALTKLSGGQPLELDWQTFGPLPSLRHHPCCHAEQIPRICSDVGPPFGFQRYFFHVFRKLGADRHRLGTEQCSQIAYPRLDKSPRVPLTSPTQSPNSLTRQLESRVSRVR